jgi:protein-S-isoprenylcysteine O-methyltransferase Ste14
LASTQTTPTGSLQQASLRFLAIPSYVAFRIIMLGQFLIFTNWLLLVYLGAATWLFHRQVLREEVYLIQHYGKEYSEYCARVRRYV